MVFSSPVFLFFFLPAALLLDALAATTRIVQIRNAVLFAISLVFFAWGEGYYVALLLTSIGMNYLFGLAIGRGPERMRKAALGLGVAGNLALLGFYKYFNFVIDSANWLLAPLGGPAIVNEPVHLPIGISFFTFQAITYLVDVNRGRAREQSNPISLGLYIALFPQLIAGPIVRYEAVDEALRGRRVTDEMRASGARLFILGLAKKVLLADSFARIADTIFAHDAADISTPLAWLGIASYSLQIFFDFAGYSDMARGIGRALGFEFPLNFNQPYSSRSIREFWRRWHISLSTWFRDYLYIPLGGSRHGTLRTYFNLIFVFFLTGLWHGASWSFVFWGLFHGAFLIVERQGPVRRLLDDAPRVLAQTYVLLAVMVGWVFFRIEAFPDALRVLSSMFWPHFPEPQIPTQLPDNYFTPWTVTLLVIGTVIALSRRDHVDAWAAEMRRSRPVAFEVGASAASMALLIVALAGATASTYSPFIYFRF